VLELASVPWGPRWAAGANSLAAVYLGSNLLADKCAVHKTGRNFVVVQFNQYYFFSVYIAPSETNNDFHVTRDELSAVIRATGGGCVVTGDFNVKSILWESPGSVWRRLIIERWAAELELKIMNVGNVPTCVQSNGSSIVDLT